MAMFSIKSKKEAKELAEYGQDYDRFNPKLSDKEYTEGLADGWKQMKKDKKKE